MNKVKSYAELVIENLEKEGEESGAQILRCRLDGTYKSLNKAVLD